MEGRIGQAFEFSLGPAKIIYVIMDIDYGCNRYTGKKIDASGTKSKIFDWALNIDIFEKQVLQGSVYQLGPDFQELVAVTLSNGAINKVPRGSLVVYREKDGIKLWIQTYLDTERGREEAEKTAKRNKAQILTIQ